MFERLVEWIEEREIPVKEIAFRAVYCYLLAEGKRDKLNLELIMEKIGVCPEEAAEYRENESKFQKRVTGKRLSMGEVRLSIGTSAVDPKALIQPYLERIPDRRIQIYFDRGKGFSEPESCYLSDVYVSETRAKVKLNVDGNVRALRIDPADKACVVEIKQLLWNGAKVNLRKKNIITNGKMLKEGYYAFATEDPNICLQIDQLECKAENWLEAELEIVKMSINLATGIVNAVKKIF